MSTDNGRYFALAYGRLLKEAREQLGLTREQAAHLVGFTDTEWSDREDGRHDPYFAETVELVEKLGLHPPEFFKKLFRYRREFESCERGADEHRT